MQMSPSDLQSSRMRRGQEWEDGGWCNVSDTGRTRHLLWKEGELATQLSANVTAAYAYHPGQQMYTRVYICCLTADGLTESWP